MDSYSNDDTDTSLPSMDSSAPQYYDAFMEFLHESTDMKRTATYSVKQGLYAGGGAMTGSMILGPVGGLVGGVVGSVVGFMRKGNYTGMVQQLMDLRELDQRNKSSGSGNGGIDGTGEDGDKQTSYCSELLNTIQKVIVTAAGGATAAGIDKEAFRSPDAFKETLLKYAAQSKVRDQIWEACLAAMKASSGNLNTGSTS